MASTTAFAGEGEERLGRTTGVSKDIYASVLRVFDWVKKNDFRGYDTFDGLNAKLARPFTFETKLLRTVLQQAVRRIPVNLRPVLGVKRGMSTKAMGFFARGFIRLHACTNEQFWADEATSALDWLIAHQSSGYDGACWGNHFDYQSREFYLPKGVPTVVWTSLIGHAFLDGYAHFKSEKYLQTAVSACNHILMDLSRSKDGEGECLSYVPGIDCQVHNANTLGASLLARTYALTQSDEYLNVAREAIRYTAKRQRPDGSWWYGEKPTLHWVDNFHTAYVLDCFKHYSDSTGDKSYDDQLDFGYKYWKATFFLEDGTPKYYNHKVLPLDIQCSSQAIDTLVFFSDRDPQSIALAENVARWTITNMQGRDGHFYYRRYNPWVVNKTATLHWGQATMVCALGGLLQQLQEDTRLA